ncbi:MAG: hypothetical protein HY020_05255 [Burkholderiales bacterium]|nr:hypothetical protein [Burkholderiales bacterium]
MLTRRVPVAWLGATGLLARSVLNGIDPTPYLVSGKLDGVHALWNGAPLRFRSGCTVVAAS